MTRELHDALHLDFETRSTVNLRQAGPWVYGENWSTDVWCACFALGDGPIEEWHPGDPVPDTISRAAAGTAWASHNAGFERAILQTIMGPRYGWPVPPIQSWYCTASMAAAMSLARDLAGAAFLMKCADQKDQVGHKLMMKMMKPARTVRCPLCAGKGQDCVVCKERGFHLYWHDDPHDIARLTAYCKQDVATERALAEKLFPLSPLEREIWMLDQTINERGVQVDLPTVTKAQKIVAEAIKELNGQMSFMTGLLTTQVTRLRALLMFEGIHVENLRKETIVELLQSQNLDALVQQALELRQEAAKTSTSKLNAYARRTCADGRMRDNLMYHGAGTGRWCLTGDHEVLTPEGWCRFDQWKGGPIAVWNPQEEISFQKCLPLQFEYSGLLFHHESQRIDQLATPEHKMPSWCMKTGNFEVREVQDRGRWHLPFHGTRKPGQALNPDELRVLVMVQADGGYTEDGQLRLHFRKDRKVERCKTLLRRAGLVYSMRFERNGCVTFLISRRHMPLYLSMFRDKIFRGWLLDCDPAVFFDELEHWDAYRCGPQSLQYVTTVKPNADMVQALAHTSGMAATITQKKDRRPEWSDAYYVSVWLTPGHHHEVRYPPGQVGHKGLVYCAETPTGFFLVRRNGKAWVTGNSGRGAQLQNLPSRFLLKPFQVEAAIEAIANDWSGEDLRRWFDTPLEVVSASLRGMITAGPGKIIYAGDYNAIEARGTAWLAGAEDMLGVFQRGEDPYLFQAAKTYKYIDLSAVDWSDKKSVDAIKGKYKRERQPGKIAVLGLGYQMGWQKYQATCMKERVVVTDKEAQEIVFDYRHGNPEIPDLWREMQDAAIQAVLHPEKRYACAQGKTAFLRRGTWLYLQLPSGRLLSYAQPVVKKRPLPWIDEDTRLPAQGWGVCYHGVDSLTHKWKEQYSYGGRWVENCTQGLCRDILACAMLRLEGAGYPIIVSVHDEAVSEVPEGFGSVKEYERIMCEPLPWADGMPVVAEGWSGKRYRK